MNIFEGLKKYRKEKAANSIDDTEKECIEYESDKGIYINDYTTRSYSEMCREAASAYEDAFEEDSDAVWNID